MERKLKYVSPEYQRRLEDLADLLVTHRRFGEVALEGTVELQLPLLDNNETVL